TTVGLCAAVEARTGVPCVPLFWMHGEDSDFAEIRGALVADSGLTVHELQLPAEIHREGQMVGGLPVAALAALEARALAIQAGVRRKVTPAEARAAGAGTALVPSVALRPVVQDALFPTVAMACGPGEAAYLAQLREVFEGLGVRGAAPVPRLSATWLPPAAGALLEAAGAEPAELLASPDAVLKRVAERKVPAEVRAALAGARSAALEGLARLAESSKRVDAS